MIDHENAVATAAEELGKLQRDREECFQRHEKWRLAIGGYEDAAVDRMLKGEEVGADLAEATMKFGQEAANLILLNRMVEKAEQKLQNAREQAKTQLAEKSEALRNELVAVLAGRLKFAQEVEVDLLAHEEWERRILEGGCSRASMSFQPIAPETASKDSLLALWLRHIRSNGIDV
ncbi:MAG: hypothetical protein HYY46_11930 [Deltaproteobacteria bacterium]|nr:hypothetical protein [Deltaproteobacteria bacterium]